MSNTKKLFLCFSVIICGLLLVTGCDSTKNDTSKSEDKNASEEVLKKDIPEGEYNDMGNGEFYVSTPSGTSENGNIPVFFVDEDTLAGKVYESGVDLGINAGGFDGSKLSTIYVDGTAVKTVENPICDETRAQFNIGLANIWNEKVGSYGLAFPTESLKIEFTVSGLGGGEATEAPAEAAE